MEWVSTSHNKKTWAVNYDSKLLYTTVEWATVLINDEAAALICHERFLIWIAPSESGMVIYIVILRPPSYKTQHLKLSTRRDDPPHA